MESPYDIEPAEPSPASRVPSPAAFGRTGGFEPELHAALDEAGRLADEIGCRRCAYNLRGLDLLSACPECGTAVGWSVRGDLLEYCDPDWVETLARGARYLVAVIVLAVGAVILAIAAATGIPIAGFAFMICALALAMLQLVAYWFLTAPDPGALESDSVVSVRSAARVLLIGSAVAGMVVVALELAIGASAELEALGVVFELAGVGGFFALCVHAGRLAARLPDDRLQRSTRIVMWGYGVSAVFVALSGVAGEVLGCMGLVGLVFLIWGAVLVFRYRDGLVYAAEAARRTWARA